MNRVLVSGLLAGAMLAGTATAAEPANTPLSPTATAGIKVGIDPTTGRVRALTEEESAVLDATVVAQPFAKSGTLSSRRSRLPETEADALATARPLANGATAMKASASSLSTVVATIDAHGTVNISHEGDAVDARPGQREIAGE
jgi:hypothetical protein